MMIGMMIIMMTKYDHDDRDDEYMHDEYNHDDDAELILKILMMMTSLRYHY